MEVGRGLVYPCQTMLDDVEIDASSYAMVKVDMVHKNLEDLKLEVPPDGTTLTMRDVVTRRVQWRWTSIDVDPSAIALACKCNCIYFTLLLMFMIKYAYSSFANTYFSFYHGSTMKMLSLTQQFLASTTLDRG
jgi:hypothetical protein